MSKRNVRSMPPGGRVHPTSGQITLMFKVDDQGKERRLSQRKILRTEPASYATVDEAWEGRNRVLAYLKQEINRAATVAGFWDRWTDIYDKQWGAKGTECPERGEHTIGIYRSHTRAFVKGYGEREMASIDDADIRAWTQHPDYTPSGMTALGTFLSDATTAGLRAGLNPVTPYAKKAEAYLRGQREDKRHMIKPPKLPVIDEMLDQLQHPDYPRSLYGWFLTGTRTGARGAEIDGMQFKYVDFEAGVYQIDYQLHHRTNLLDEPKHKSRRPMALDDDILAEIRAARRFGDTLDGEGFIWLNTRSLPWRHGSRQKWWTKKVNGRSLQDIVGGDGITVYNATRHHWASWAVNETDLSLYQISIAYGHKDGGRLIAKTYAHKDHDAMIAAVKAASATRPRNLGAMRRRAA